MLCVGGGDDEAEASHNTHRYQVSVGTSTSFNIDTIGQALLNKSVQQNDQKCSASSLSLSVSERLYNLCFWSTVIPSYRLSLHLGVCQRSINHLLFSSSSSFCDSTHFNNDSTQRWLNPKPGWGVGVAHWTTDVHRWPPPWPSSLQPAFRCCQCSMMWVPNAAVPSPVKCQAPYGMEAWRPMSSIQVRERRKCILLFEQTQPLVDCCCCCRFSSRQFGKWNVDTDDVVNCQSNCSRKHWCKNENKNKK